MTFNPFPGAQPYRASDRSRFYGRGDLAYKLGGSILAHRCVTVYGPSGAGKSSLVQAAVMPALAESHEIRVVRVDSWPETEDPTAWLAHAVHDHLGLGAPPEGAAPDEAVLAAAQRAARRSPRIVVIYLDQIEQLLYASRSMEKMDALFECIDRLADTPLRNVRLVLSLREDYLGRFRDRLRGKRRLLDHGFRVGPLTVAELCDAVCQAAAAGEPPQQWSPERMRLLMLQVRVPGQAESDEAEAQAAYAQIVCRALFQERAQAADEPGKGTDDIEAEPILRRYLETTLNELGPMREAAQRLLEDHLITADGGRTVRTEKELSRLLVSEHLSAVLKALEDAAILHAEEHQGSRYFELGHDWLARKVHEERQARERAEEQRRLEEEQKKEQERLRLAAEARIAKERAQRRRLGIVAALSLAVAAVTGALGFWAWKQKQAAEAARRAADEQRRIAMEQRSEAHDASLLAGFRELSARGQLAWAMKLLPEVHLPAERRGWVELASDALIENALRVTLEGHQGPLSSAAWSPDGKAVLTASGDRTARVFSADGSGQPVVLKGHEEAISLAAWSPDGKRVVTASEDGTARVFSADGSGAPVVLKGHEGPVLYAAWSPDGKRVVTASADSTARVWDAGGSGAPAVLKGHTDAVYCAVFHPVSQQVITASGDRTVRLWEAGYSGKHQVLRGHTDKVLFVAASKGGERIVSTSLDDTARVWDGGGKGPPAVLKGHESGVFHAAISPDGKLVATASADRTARIWGADGKGEPVVLKGHDLAVSFIAFSPDSKYVATASADRTARLWRADGSGAPLVLSGHQAGVRTVAWSPDGSRMLTADGDRTGRAQSYTAKVWSTEPLRSMPRALQGSEALHSAFIGADDKRVASAYDDKAARVFSIDGAGEPVVLKGHEAWVASAALSPDGERVVTASFDKTARVWSADGEGDPIVLKGHEAPVRHAVFTPDGKRVVTVSEDRTARVWSADGTGAPTVLSGHEDWLSSAAVSPGGAQVVTTSLDRSARVWNLDGSGAPVLLSGHGGDVYAAAWSPDGKRIATASEDQSARIWNADGSGKPVVLSGHTGAVLCAAWSPDGKRVATSSADRTVRLWNADGSGEPIVLDTSAPVMALRFLDGGQRLLTVSSDGSVHTVMIDVEALKERLLHAHADCLPPAMRAIYLREPAKTAREQYADCERSHGRTPFFQEPVEPGAHGPGGRRVTVTVLPGDASVEVDGASARRRDGIVELTGKPGEVRRLRIFKGTQQMERDVTIQEAGASPPLLDLSTRPAPQGVWAEDGKASSAAKAQPALLPDDFQ